MEIIPALKMFFWNNHSNKIIEKHSHLLSDLPGVGGVEPRELEDLELSKLSMFDDELVLLKNITRNDFSVTLHV